MYTCCFVMNVQFFAIFNLHIAKFTRLEKRNVILTMCSWKLAIANRTYIVLVHFLCVVLPHQTVFSDVPPINIGSHCPLWLLRDVEHWSDLLISTIRLTKALQNQCVPTLIAVLFSRLTVDSFYLWLCRLNFATAYSQTE